MSEDPSYASDSDRAFWAAFEARLATKPACADRSGVRRGLMRTAYVDATRRARSAVGPEEFADIAYRLRFELGPTLSGATLERVRAQHAADAAALIAEGVDPRLLGLAG